MQHHLFVAVFASLSVTWCKRMTQSGSQDIGNDFKVIGTDMLYDSTGYEKNTGWLVEPSQNDSLTRNSGIDANHKLNVNGLLEDVTNFRLEWNANHSQTRKSRIEANRKLTENAFFGIATTSMKANYQLTKQDDKTRKSGIEANSSLFEDKIERFQTQKNDYEKPPDKQHYLWKGSLYPFSLADVSIMYGQSTLLVFGSFCIICIVLGVALLSFCCPIPFASGQPPSVNEKSEQFPFVRKPNYNLPELGEPEVRFDSDIPKPILDYAGPSARDSSRTSAKTFDLARDSSRTSIKRKSRTSDRFSVIKFPEEFQVATSDSMKQSFRWMSPAEAKDRGLPWSTASPMEALSQGLVDAILAPWSPLTIQDALTKGGVDVTPWPMEKIEHLAREVAEGKACLLLNTRGQIRRLTQIVQVIVIHPTTGQVIVRKEIFTQTSSSNQYEAFRSQMKNLTDSSLSIRRLPSESVATAAERCLQEKLNVEPDIVELNLDTVKSVDSEEFSDFYPGLTTLVQRHIILGDVVTTNEQQLKSIAADSLSIANNRGFQTQYNFWGETKVLSWCWQTPEQTPDLRKELSWLRARVRETLNLNDGASSATSTWASSKWKHATKQAAIGALAFKSQVSGNAKLGARGQVKRDSITSLRDSPFEVMTPWNEFEVKDLLGQYETSAEALGMSFQELCAGAAQGQFVFGRHQGSGKLVIVQEFALLKVVAHTGAVLVQTDAPLQRAESMHVSKSQFAWPTLHMQPHETAWDAARRIARICLGLDDDDLSIETQPQLVSEEAEESDMSWRTRKWLVVGKMNPEAVVHGHLHADKLS